MTDEQHFATLRSLGRTIGPVLGPFECYLTMRGIKTFPLRMERQCANACKVAQWLSSHAAVERVYFPGDPAHPDASTVARLFPKHLTGGLVAFEIKNADRSGVMGTCGAVTLALPAVASLPAAMVRAVMAFWAMKPA